MRGASAAAPAATTPPAPEGERKQVTVLFADVVRSMDLAERLDPDELTQIMTGLVQVCREAVERFGGTLDKFTGDGVMALFGAPLAQEDHARRACHAAVVLLNGVRSYASTLRQRDIDLAVRVGLNSGEVVAGSVAEAFTAVGHTVGLAQRMENLAEPGSAYLSEHTAALIGHEFELRVLGKNDVKGSRLPVEVFALEGLAGGARGTGRRSGSARMVGRDEEFATLVTALAHAGQGRAQVVGLVGEAGAGKSRLCEELAQRASAEGITVRRTSGVSHAQTVPLLPILALYRDYFAISPGDTPAEVREKVGSRMLGLDAGLVGELGLIFDFLEVPDPDRPAPQLGPDIRRRRVLEVIRRVAQSRSEHETLLFVLEDLHLFDAASVAFLEAWFPSFPGTRTLIVTNFRPEFHAPWTNHSYYRQLPLAPLDEESVEAQLGELLGPGPGLGALTRQLQTRAGGNPFFAEELVRGLASDGTLTGGPGNYALARSASEVRVPPTVQAVLAARIDRLDGREKAALQAAAVIGRTFTEAILGVVAAMGADELSNVLYALRAAELLQQSATAGDYRFWHPLTQEVAYGTLLASARHRLHHAVATALVMTYPDREDDQAALVASHFEAADDDLEAGRWELRAGARAMHTNFAEASRRFARAIDHLNAVPDTPDTQILGVRARTFLLRLGARTGMDGAQIERLFVEARPIAEKLGDAALLAGLSIADGVARLLGGEAADGVASYREACRLADAAGEPALRAPSRIGLTFGLSYTGPFSDCTDVLEELFSACGDDPLVGTTQFGFSIRDSGFCFQSIVATSAGRLGDAKLASRTALDLFALRPATEWQAWTLAQLAYLADCTGEAADVEPAARAAAEALALATDSGNVAAAVRARQAMGLAALLRGVPGEAVAILDEALSEARHHRSGLQEEANLLAYLARAHLALDDTFAARAAADEAVTVALRQGARVPECLAQLVRTQVWRGTAADDADLQRARAALHAGEAVAAEIGAATYTAFLAEERARLEPDPAAQLAGLRSAAGAYTAIGATGHARRLQAEVVI